ncbi:DNA-binding transcriptional regulator, MarR family [Allopseudospirillum japonicum]|uniref:DNA-binding transcriptional regulator, MarR family n=1 Tax=Allopseudospirillum japonicum TaxID=64971 RepID=A0A1H6QHN8_9GAMM|nr:MarR family transcriptional regulator [Allopseudospirillum japonicum]SEI38755.1 DNA-binding transcriptional regulator, MarR family [Allopseudospirillum japonicum]
MPTCEKNQVFTDIVLEIFKLGGLLVQEGDRMGSAYGISSARWKVLGALSLAGQAQTASQIAQSMGLTRQAVQRLVDVMSADGLLVFHDNPQHKRAKLISLSTEGQEVYAQLASIQKAWASQCTSGIQQAELETTMAVLRKLSQILDT